LHYLKFTLEENKVKKKIFKSKRFSRLQQVLNPEIGDSYLLTSSYMAYCLTIIRRQLQSKENLFDSITM